MYRLLFIIFILFGFNKLTFSQTCLHTDLSIKFNIEITSKRFKDDSCVVIIAIKDKANNETIQTIKYSTSFLFDKVFKNCESVRSYQTHFKDSLEALDNDFGDLVVADFNFDGNDDFAIIKDSGGNGGPLYNFYTQDKKGKFIFDRFLTEQMEFFPTQIDKNNRILVTYVHAGVCWLGEHVYSINDKTNKWFVKSHKTIDICKK